MSKKMSIQDYLGCEMCGFFVKDLYEVFGLAEDGRVTEVVGYFLRVEAAELFACKTGGGRRQFRIVQALTDGRLVFVFDGAVTAELFLDEKSEVEMLRKHALSKLSQVEKEVLNLE